MLGDARKPAEGAIAKQGHPLSGAYLATPARWRTAQGSSSCLQQVRWPAARPLLGCPDRPTHACMRAGSLPALDGVRALACACILAGHCMFALGFAWPERYPEWYAALDAHPWMLALVNLLEPAMDTLLILAGFLAARALLPAFRRDAKRSAWQVAAAYYRRRAVRLLPSYYATLAFVRLAFLRAERARWAAPEAKRAIFTVWFNARDGCPRALWANWLFANNQLRRAGCMKHAWSQAVQVQFYLALPLLLCLLRPRRAGLAARLALASCATIAAVTAYRAAAALTFRLPVPVFGPLDSPEALQLMTHTLMLSYYSLVPRLTHLSFGVLGACAAADGRLAAGLLRRRRAASASAAAAAAFVAATLATNRFGPEPDPTHPLASPAARVVGVAGVTGLLQPAALTYLLLFAALGGSPAVTRALSSKRWRLVSDASYDLYLLHPMVMLAVWSAAAPSAWFALPDPSPARFAAVTAAVFGASLLAAHAHRRAWAWVMGKL